MISDKSILFCIVRNASPSDHDASSNFLKVQNSHKVEHGNTSKNEIEMMPLNSPTDSLDTPDILIDPTKIEENCFNGNTKKRKASSRLTLTLSKRNSTKGDNVKSEKDTVTLD